jgi:hypothetical protein
MEPSDPPKQLTDDVAKSMSMASEYARSFVQVLEHPKEFETVTV